MRSMLDSIQHVWVLLNTRACYNQTLLDTGKIPAGTHMPVLISPLPAEPATRVRATSYL